jgi:hypothetical protein
LKFFKPGIENHGEEDSPKDGLKERGEDLVEEIKGEENQGQ